MIETLSIRWENGKYSLNSKLSQDQALALLCFLSTCVCLSFVYVYISTLTLATRKQFPYIPRVGVGKGEWITQIDFVKLIKY